MFTTFWGKKDLFIYLLNQAPYLAYNHENYKFSKNKNQAPYLNLTVDAWLNNKWISLQLQNLQFLKKKEWKIK